MRKFTSLATIAAVVVTSTGFGATAAEARGRHDDWDHHDRDRVSTGDVVGGLFIIGAIAAIAGAAGKKKRDQQDRDVRYDPLYRDADNREIPRYEPEKDSAPGAYGRGEAEARAADACSWAVEGEMGEGSRVDGITGTEAAADGWYVTGTASRIGSETRSFGCSYRNGRVVDVRYNP